MLIVKKAYDEHMLGNIFTIESKLHSANGYMHEWHIYKKYGGGMIYDWGVHLIDQILFMMPNVKIKSIEYSCAAEPPVRCGVSHLSRRNEPL